MENNIEIITDIESFDYVNYNPESIIFFKRSDILYHVKISVSIETLKRYNYYTVFSYLENNLDYLLDILQTKGDKTNISFVEEIFNNKESFISEKKKLSIILRKQKIDNLISKN